jgi:hypothetical protein
MIHVDQRLAVFMSQWVNQPDLAGKVFGDVSAGIAVMLELF